jgi:hypothetical protein
MTIEPPQITDEFIDGVVVSLGVEDANRRSWLVERLRSFATAHWYLRQTFKPRRSYADSRKAAVRIADLSGRLAKLLADLHLEVEGAFALSADHLTEAGKKRSAALPSAESLKFLSEVASDVSGRLPSRGGRTNDRILELSVGAMMAVLEQATGKRAAVGQRRAGTYSPHLLSAEARAIGDMFKVVEPSLLETTLTNVITDLNRRYSDRPIHENYFLPLVGAPVYVVPADPEH